MTGIPTLKRTLKEGITGADVRVAQEWLCLHGWNVSLDGEFGPATTAAVERFQRRTGIGADGVIGPRTWTALVAPLSRATAAIASSQSDLGRLVVAYARQHLAEAPREVGGQNRGPWVRLYMDNNEGESWAWCGGFVCFVLRQACTTLGVPLPVTASFSCDSLAASAQRNARFVTERDAADRSRVRPGSLFLQRRTPTDWDHTGIVLRAEAETFETIEGNTNDDGSREGYEVCRRFRGYGSKDFIVWANG